jgi:D-threonate/D-erythronate kinase
MIAVIADDLTGAAEIAGIGLRYGLIVELATTVTTGTEADLLVVSTDSRSLTRDDAKKVTIDVVKAILLLKPDLIYKKIDSVLRGYVLDELNIQMEVTGLRRSFVLPVNPSLGRTIKDGLYYINGTAISETSFATDPEFAITDSSVLKMIRTPAGEEKILKQPGSLPPEGIVIGEAETTEEVRAWAAKIDKGWVVAGAGDFFIALLDKKYKAVAQPATEIQMPHLYVCGTAFEKSKAFVWEVKMRSGCVAYLPSAMMQSGNVNDANWLKQVDEIMATQQRCVIAIKPDSVPDSTAQALRDTMAKAVKKVVEETIVSELFIEGGATAAAILKELEITTLQPVDEMQRGVVRMKARVIYITVKPGSYLLPEQIKNLYLLNKT